MLAFAGEWVETVAGASLSTQRGFLGLNFDVKCA
jgi:hypothetical protein